MLIVGVSTFGAVPVACRCRQKIHTVIVTEPFPPAADTLPVRRVLANVDVPSRRLQNMSMM